MSEDRVLVIDTETTGLDHETDAVVEVACRLGLEDDAEARVWKIHPHCPISEIATKTHGITFEMTLEWPTFAEVADQIAETIEWATVIVGYNPDFDVRMLTAELGRCGLKTIWPRTVICGKRMWDIYDPPPPRHLQAAYAKFVDPSGFEGAHGALADALAVARVVRAQRGVFSLQEKTWEDLDPARKSWWCGSNHVTWSEDRSTLLIGFGKHSGKDVRDLDAGYLRYINDQQFPTHVKALAAKLAPHAKNRTRPSAGTMTSWAIQYEQENTR